MPSFPCPHCDAKYGRREVLQTHMQFRHQAAQSSGNQAQGGPRTTSATATAAAATVAIPAGLHRRQLATVMTGPYGPTQRAVTVTMPMAPPSANRFTIVFNARDITGATSMTVPVNEPFAAFLDRLRALSVPVAGRYLQGRTNGFTLADGAWRYSLVDFDGNQADGRRLDSNLYYLTMVSELRRSGSPYAYALVWNDAQDGSLLPVEGTTATTSSPERYQPPPLQSYSHAQPSIPSHAVDGPSYLGDAVPRQPSSSHLKGPGQARTPAGIVHWRRENGEVAYRVTFLEGGPARWMPVGELQALGHQAMVDDWERSHASSAAQESREDC